MNVDNIKLLIERLNNVRNIDDPHSTKPNGFNMNYIKYNCGTPACIAGWAAWYQLGKPEVLGDGVRAEQRAAEWLGIRLDWAMEHLFYPKWWVTWEAIRPSDAVEALTNIMEAGDNYMALRDGELWGMNSDERAHVEADYDNDRRLRLATEGEM